MDGGEMQDKMEDKTAQADSTSKGHKQRAQAGAHLLGARAGHDARLDVRVGHAAAVQRVVVEGLGGGREREGEDRRYQLVRVMSVSGGCDDGT